MDPSTPRIVYTQEAGPSRPSSTSSSPATQPSPRLPTPASPRLTSGGSRLAKYLLPGRSRSSSTTSLETAIPVLADDAEESGRSTPEQKRRTGRVAASLLSNDPRYKKFAAQVDRALQSFESVNEWADFISFLSRLLKTLQAPHPPFHEIPRKLVVSKRLAQCLNPALPSGVHQRALEVYVYIFGIMGVEGLKRDLLIWSSGLFPFFQFATTSVRPHLLNIYETYYLPLGEELRPATKAMTLALLPGMEEETGDFFERVLALLTRLSDTVTPDFFLHNIFMIMVSSPTARLAALYYLSKRLLESPNALQSGLVVRGLAAVLEDENALVRRNGLDLLLGIAKMDSDLYISAEAKDKDLLLGAVVGVVLQRDISLTRRVYTWLLGPSETAEQQVEYFKKHALESLSRSLQLDMENHSSNNQSAFRIFLALLDKWEISVSLGERLVIPALRAVKQCVDGDEQTITANAICEAVEPAMMWTQIYRLLGEGHSDDVKLVQWLLETIRLHEEVALRVYLPAILQCCLERSGVELARAQYLVLANTLLRLVPVQLFRAVPPSVESSSAHAAIFAADSTPNKPSDMIHNNVMPWIIDRLFAKPEPDPEVDDQTLLRMTAHLLDIEADVSNIDLTSWLAGLPSRANNAAFATCELVCGNILRIARSSLSQTADNVQHVCVAVMTLLLRYLRLDQSVHHIQAVQLLWELKPHTGVYDLENAICQRLLSNRPLGFEEFGTLWRFTDDALLPGDIFFTPIMNILDGLASKNPTSRRVSESWLRINLGPWFRLLDPIMYRLFDFDEDVTIHIHLLDTVAALFRFGAQSLGTACRDARPSDSPYSKISSRPERTYLDLLVEHLLTILQPKHSTASNARLRVSDAALEVMQLLLQSGNLSHETIERIQSTLLDAAENSVRLAELELQDRLLQLIRATLQIEKPKQHRKSASISEKTVDRDARVISVVESALVQPAMRSVLRSWTDLILETAAHFRGRRDLLEALSGTLAAQLLAQIALLGAAGGLSELEPNMLLDAMEQVVMLLLGRSSERRSEDGSRAEGGGGSSLLGLMSGVFIVEGPAHETAEDIRWLDDVVHALLSTWSSIAGGSHTASRELYQSRILARVRQVLEKMFRARSLAVFTSLIRLWATKHVDVRDAAIFQAVDYLTASAQKAVEMVGFGLKGGGEQSVNEASAGFLEAYIRRLEAPIAVQIWSTTFSLSRDVSASATTPVAKAHLYPLLRCLTALAKTVATTSALEDKRLRRDLQDAYAKLLDNVMTHLPRMGEAVFWSREVQLEGQVTVEVNTFVANEILPNLRSFLVENDRVAVACSSIASGLLGPAFRQQKVEPSTLNVVQQMTHLAPAARSWRPYIGDAFNDARFFRITVPESQQWQPLISALMDSDKDRFNELLGRITAGPSANIFINREQEMVSRSLNLRRLSFVLLAADTNHYLTQLPSIQEKLVDILRNDVVSPQVHSEVYLCLRVLMCRLSAQHLTNFWPVILSELIKVFDGTMDDPPPDGSEELLLVLATCKFLDLLLLMQSEDFQVHQWIFVTDTTDAAFPLEGYEPEAIMDRLNEVLTEHSHGPNGIASSAVLTWEEQTGPRRPRLSGIRTIHSLHQLQPFFARASIDTFEAVYSGQGVDWEAVEQGLSEEIFDGR